MRTNAYDKKIKEVCDAFNNTQAYTESGIRTICPRASRGTRGLRYDFGDYGKDLIIAPMYAPTAHPDFFVRTIFLFIPDGNDTWKLRAKIGSLSEAPEKDLPAS